MPGKTLYQKLWQAHAVCETAAGATVLYIDRHLVHEVTSPQAFEGLALAGRQLWRKDAMLAVPDHSIPTVNRDRSIADPIARRQVEALRQNVRKHGLKAFWMDDPRQGIVHVIGPEQGFVLPGATVVCGDSHTATHGAFGALAFGIGTSEVEHVMATQCLLQQPSKTLLVRIDGAVGPGVTAKDMALAIIGRLGAAGGAGYAMEFAGEAVRRLSMEGRMTLCNLAIEAGARVGLVAVDETTIDYIQGRPLAPGPAHWDGAVAT